MKTRTVLSWLLLAGVLASGAAQATHRDAGAIYTDALHLAWQPGEIHAKESLPGMDSHLIRDHARDRNDLQPYYASVRAAARTWGQLELNVYALGCVIYLAFIFFLGLFVGFNELDKDK